MPMWAAAAKNNLRISPPKTVHFSAPPCPNAVPGTYDDSPPRCLVFCSAASERNRTHPNAFAAIRLSGFSLCIPHFALCTQKPIQNPPISHPKNEFLVVRSANSALCILHSQFVEGGNFLSRIDRNRTFPNENGEGGSEN